MNEDFGEATLDVVLLERVSLRVTVLSLADAVDVSYGEAGGLRLALVSTGEPPPVERISSEDEELLFSASECVRRVYNVLLCGGYSGRSVSFFNGSAVIEDVRIVVDLPDAFIVEADMRTKYAVIEGFMGDDGDADEVFVGVTGDSLYADTSVSHCARIVPHGLEGGGWSCVADCGRYTARVCWYRRRGPERGAGSSGSGEAQDEDSSGRGGES